MNVSRLIRNLIFLSAILPLHGQIAPSDAVHPTTVADPGASSLAAQNSPAQPPTTPSAQAVQTAVENPTDTLGSSSSPNSRLLKEEDWVAGGRRFPFQVGMTIGGYYDDNIYAQPGGPGKVSDFIWSVTPLLAWNSASQTGANNSIQLAYAPSILFYQQHSQNDTVDQTGDFIYAYHGGKTDLTISEAIASVQDTNADYGGLVNSLSSTTEVNWNYQMTGKTALNFIAMQNLTDVDPGLSATEWTLAGYFDYQWSPKTTIGLGGLGGYADIDGPDQTFEQANARVNFNPTEKLSFNATFGYEFRQTQGSGTNSATPDFSLGGNFQPYDGTNFVLEAYRRYEYSGKFYGEDYLATGASASISQRIVQRFYFVVSGVFEDADYRNNFSNTNSGQSYDYYSVRPTVIFRPTEWCDLTFFYQYRNTVSDTVTSFADNQVGFSARFTY